MNPKVTVLLPVFNGAKYLTQAVDSILGQSFRDFEFLVIDDGSTDDSSRLVEAYGDPRLRFIRNRANLGLVAALNKGLLAARGEYVARMDADDISHPRRLAKQVRFLDAHPRVGVCGSWVRFFPGENGYLWKLPQGPEEIRCWSFHTVGVAHPAVMLRRQLFIEHGLFYDAQYCHVEDYELWGRALHYMEFANLPEVLLDYRLSADQVCSRHSREQLEGMASLRAQKLRELGIEPTVDEQLLHEAVMNCTALPDHDFLDRADRWLLQVASANRRADKYDVHLFETRLVQIWFSLCLGLAASGVSWERCRDSELWRRAHTSLLFRARALAAWISRR